MTSYITMKIFDTIFWKLYSLYEVVYKIKLFKFIFLLILLFAGMHDVYYNLFARVNMQTVRTGKFCAK